MRQAYLQHTNTLAGGELITIYEKEGEEGVLRFAAEKIEPMMYENGEQTQTIKFADYVRWKKSVVSRVFKFIFYH